MGKRFGIFCLVLGVCCLLSSVGLLLHNHLEESRAETAAVALLQAAKDAMLSPAAEDMGKEENSQNEAADFEAAGTDAPNEMLTTKVSGYDCIGVLSIPVLELELPVLTDWSYEKLNIAPCLYYGTYFEPDFVIAAHNFQSHFGRLSALEPKDLILFTDVSGTVHCYEVILLETLPGNATEEMITSGFDLSLYTCTPGGGSRVTVRCSRVSGE